MMYWERITLPILQETRKAITGKWHILGILYIWIFASVKSDLCQCSFCWKDDLTLLAAWGSFIKMCCIKVRSHDSELSLASITSSDRLPKYYVELGTEEAIENSQLD